MKSFIYLILVMTMVFSNSLNALADDYEGADLQDDAVIKQATFDYYDDYESQVITRLEFKICDMKYKQCLLERAESFNDLLICKALYEECLERHEGDKSE